MNRLKISPVLLHIFSWVLFMAFPLLFLSQGRELNHLSMETLLAYLLFVGLFMAIFYINTQFLLPAFFLKRKYIVYFTMVLVMFSAVYIIKPFHNLVNGNAGSEHPGPPMAQKFNSPPGVHDGHRPPGRPPQFEGDKDVNLFDITSMFIFIMIIGIGAAFESMKQSHLYETRAIQAEAEKANAELSFLKAQINPHFLYNTLNNIYTLSITGSENASDSIMRLSNIMRYVTDESEANFVPLQGEIDCISNFIALQRLRLGKKVNLMYTVMGDASGYLITPLLFMTYVENVFKYGLSNHVDSEIEISIKIEDKKIQLYTRNQVFSFKTPDERKGVGLENTQKRLNYLYPNQHSLTIKNKDGLFSVLLILESK